MNSVKHTSHGFPSPPHFMVRPSILIVGPFLKNKKRTNLILEFIGNLSILKQTIPPLHLILVGSGATDCFQELYNRSVILVDSEENIESYVYYANVLIHFRGTSVLQSLALSYAQKTNRPVIKYPVFHWKRNKNQFLMMIARKVLSPDSEI
jgi:hypothetical protein